MKYEFSSIGILVPEGGKKFQFFSPYVEAVYYEIYSQAVLVCGLQTLLNMALLIIILEKVF